MFGFSSIALGKFFPQFSLISLAVHCPKELLTSSVWEIILCCCCSSVANRVWLFATPWTGARHVPLSFTISWSLLKLTSLSWWCHPTISSSIAPFSYCPQYFPASRSFTMSWLFASGDQSFGASASVLPVDIQGWFPLGWTVSISLLSRDSQESSLAPKFESINPSVFSLLYGPTLTSVHDCWKDHSFDCSL